jgi:glycerol-1-phosphate dehydrogenase [NAD(P)+]
MDITKIELHNMTCLEFDCSCGRKHRSGIKHISVESGSTRNLPLFLEPFKNVFVVTDNHTHEVCGKKVIALLKRQGFVVSHHTFFSTGFLVPDEKALGELIIELPSDTDVIVGVGSGTINDLCRMISHKCHIPYVIVATAPSMDGYASTVSPLIIKRTKLTYEAVFPYAVIADTDILKDAPLDMLYAGFGDILGKVTALTDWNLSHKISGEYYCDTIAALVNRAMQKCVDNLNGISKREPEAIKSLVEALIISGVAMGFIGNSRPASGAEHHLAHYWEIEALSKGEEHNFHGISVGVGSVVISKLYNLVNKAESLGIDIPDSSYVEDLLLKLGAPKSPLEIGITESVFYNSILNAMEIRPRFTILRHASQLGILEEAARSITSFYYK